MKARDLLIVAALCGVHLAVDAAWQAADAGVQLTDAAYHYAQVLAWAHADTLFTAPEAAEARRYGALWYAVAGRVAHLTGTDTGPLTLGLGLLLWPLLLTGAWRLGEELAAPGRRRLAGLSAAVLVGLLPGVFNFTRVVVLDLPLAAAVSWSLVGLLGALRGAPRAWPLAGTAGALALGIKGNAVGFLLGAGWVATRTTGPGGRALRPLRDLALPGAAAAAALGALALGPRGPALRETLERSTWPGAAWGHWRDGALPLLPSHWLAFVRGHSWEAAYFTVMQTFTPSMLLIVASGALWFFTRRRGCEDPLGRRQRDLVFWTVALPVAALVLLMRADWDERYLIPLLPLAAAWTGAALVDLPSRRLRLAALGGLALGGGLNLSFVSFDYWHTARPLGCVQVRGWAATERVDSELSLCLTYPQHWFLDRPTHPVDAPPALRAIEERLAPLRAARGRPLRAVFLDDLDELFYALYQRDLRRDPLLKHQAALLLTRCWDEEWMREVFESPAEVDRLLESADVVLVRWGSPADQDVAMGRRCGPWSRRGDAFKPLETVDLGDGTEVRIGVRE